MAKDTKIICPLMHSECLEDGSLVTVDGKPELHACRFYTHVQGKDPQDGSDIKRGDCAIAWLPILLIENSNVNRQTGAAVESFRNENVRTGDQIAAAIEKAAALRANQQPLLINPSQPGNVVKELP